LIEGGGRGHDETDFATCLALFPGCPTVQVHRLLKVEERRKETMITTETKQVLLKLKDRIPPEAKDAFVRGINERMPSVMSERTAYGALIGGAIGALVDVIPGTGFISDDWVTIGAGLGAWVGYARDRKERQQREQVKQMIEEALHEALA
jgi:hypothetical protein